jgi:hypothetical protein
VPKSPHDLLAFGVLFASLVGGVMLAMLAQRRFTEAQRQLLAGRSPDFPVMAVIGATVLAGFWYAPVRTFWPIVVTVVGAGFAAYRIAGRHAGQDYSPAARALLVSGAALQLGGPVAAVLLRAAP